MHTKFREFYPGDTILVKGLRKEQTWWPGSFAERSGPKSYVVARDDGRVCKRHVDRIRRDSVDSTVWEEISEKKGQDVAPDPVPQAILCPCFPFPHQPPEIARSAANGIQGLYSVGEYE